MRSIGWRFMMLIATAAVLPLVIYGYMSISRLQEGTAASVREGNLAVARQVAGQLELYVQNNARILRSLGEELTSTSLLPWQQSRILTNHVLEFAEFREISLLDVNGRALATSRLSGARTKLPARREQATQGVQVAPVFLDEDGLPTTDLSLPLQGEDSETRWLVGRLSLEELWRFVDNVHVGTSGYALVFSHDQRLIAHGDPRKKRLVVPGSGERADSLREMDVLKAADSGAATFAGVFTDLDDRKALATGARVDDLDWTAMVVQPESEAYAIATELAGQLRTAIALSVLGTIVLGWVWSRSFITRISLLTAATRSLAAGRMNERVSIGGRDEIHQLGESFNAMADRLVELQEDVRKQERQAMFGRIAAGLVHDLSHPIQNIGNSCKLIIRMFDDLEYRDTFKRTVDRELVIVKRVLDDLRNVANPAPLERFPVEINRSVAEAVDALKAEAENAGVTLRADLSPEPGFIDGDVFALGRVYRNLIVNAIQATAPGGAVTVQTAAEAERVTVRVIDTGCGISPDRLPTVFDDFVTTKRGGLGLGLAITRKIVDQLGGRIGVTSEPGRGTTFELEFPRTRTRQLVAVGQR